MIHQGLASDQWLHYLWSPLLFDLKRFASDLVGQSSYLEAGVLEKLIPVQALQLPLEDKYMHGPNYSSKQGFPVFS